MLISVVRSVKILTVFFNFERILRGRCSFEMIRIPEEMGLLNCSVNLIDQLINLTDVKFSEE